MQLPVFMISVDFFSRKVNFGRGMAYRLVIRLVSTAHCNSETTSTNDTDHSYHEQVVELA